MSLGEEHKNYLRYECVRLRSGTGECYTLACLKRGGYNRGEKPDYSKATCIAYEIHQELFNKEKAENNEGSLRVCSSE